VLVILLALNRFLATRMSGPTDTTESQTE